MAGPADEPEGTAAREAFEATMAESCPAVVIDAHSAEAADAQAEQARSALTAGARVLVMEAVDGDAAGAIVTEAQAAGATVIALGQAITGAVPTYQVAYDRPATGPLVAAVVITVAAEAASDELPEDATPIPSDVPVERVVLINGPAADAALAAWSAQVKEALGVRATVVHEAAVTGLTAVEGKRVIEEAIAAVGSDGFGAVITPGDAVAAGVIAGLDEAGVDPATLSVTGADATLPGTQAIVAGDQLLTTWEDPAPLASVAAAIACGQAIGAGFPEGLATAPVDNGTGEVPTVLLTGIVITSDGTIDGSRPVADTLVAGNAFGPDTAAQVCTDDLTEACDDAGIVVPSPSPIPSGSPAASRSPTASGSPAAAASPDASRSPDASGSPAASGAPAAGSPAASEVPAAS
jgi:D-xylose transport system substrate-binding protein